MKQTELRERRERMANEVRRGVGSVVVADTFGVTKRTVYNACHEHGVPLSNAPPTLATTLAMLAAMERGEDHGNIARQFHRNHTHVRKLYRKAEAAGLKVRMK